MKLPGFIVLIFFIIQACFSQNPDFARAVIDTLASQEFAGRGYSNDGMIKSANFIEKEFRSARLEYFHDSYRQEFTMPMNVITKAVLQKGKLRAGDDYVVSVMSSAFKGTRKIHTFQSVNFSINDILEEAKQCAGKFVLFEPTLTENREKRDLVYGLIFSGILKADGYIIGTDKQPVWDVQYSHPHLDVPVITMKGDEAFFNKLAKLHVHIETHYEPEFPVSNMAGYLPGTKYPDSFLVFCAHYDHLGKMGDVVFPGANDNASGVAMMLDLMHYFSEADNRLPFSVAFLALTAEEAGIIGAGHFAENPLFPLETIRFLINLDLVGTGKEGIQVVNGSVFTDAFQMLQQLNDQHNYLPQVKTRGEACNSDHCPFYRKGVPSFFIYTLDADYPWYHVPQDNPSVLPLTAYENLFRLLVDFCQILSIPVEDNTQ
jgi:aminopeptidase YwaD